MSFFGFGSKEPAPPPTLQVQVADEPPKNFYFGQQQEQLANATSSSSSSRAADLLNPDKLRAELPSRDRLGQLFDVGIFRDTLAPSFAIHGGLAVVSWGLARATDRVAVKDVMWPVGFAANAWWSALGRRVFLHDAPVNTVLKALSWPERLLLTGVTAWSARLFTRNLLRELRRGKDDERYTIHERSSDPSSFWAKSFFAWFLPGALVSTVVSLPFSAPFGSHQGAVLTGFHPGLQSLAVGLFSAGFALEALADYQLDAHDAEPLEGGLLRDGVWSIVRHPNYLGDALVHASFPLLLYSSDILAPVELAALLGPLANYLVLRFVGGDRATEHSQEQRYAAHDPVRKAQMDKYREDKNSFWPAPAELANPWSLVVVGAGLAGVALEWALREFVHLA